MSGFLTLSGVGSVLGAGLSYLGQQQTNAANARQAALQMQFQQAEAEKARAFDGEQAAANREFAMHQLWRQQDFAREQTGWEERMSNTAYQRATADMRAAGINPMLAISQGGASSPAAVSGGTGGGVSTPSSPMGHGAAARMENALGAAVGGAAKGAEVLGALQQMISTIGLNNSAAELKAAETATERARRDQVITNTALQRAQAESESRRPGLIAAEIERARAQAGEAGASAARHQSETLEPGLRSEEVRQSAQAHGARSVEAAASAYRHQADEEYRRAETDVLRRYGRSGFDPGSLNSQLSGAADRIFPYLQGFGRDLRSGIDREVRSRGEPGPAWDWAASELRDRAGRALYPGLLGIIERLRRNTEGR